MDRIQRNINNRKQDKISLVNSQPSLRSMLMVKSLYFLEEMEILQDIVEKKVFYGNLK